MPKGVKIGSKNLCNPADGRYMCFWFIAGNKVRKKKTLLQTDKQFCHLFGELLETKEISISRCQIYRCDKCKAEFGKQMVLTGRPE